jgi:hypothetical protein
MRLHSPRRQKQKRRVAQPKNLLGGLPLRVCVWQGWASLALACDGRRGDVSLSRFRAHIQCETIKSCSIFFGAGIEGVTTL